jgi:D-alanyl-lipoteichoic acid acyltransferase DltB (MBOAT superfamily)
MGRISNHVFLMSVMGTDGFHVPVLLAWLGLLAFMLKIYHQLSGFCDMARGLAGIFLYDLPKNFDYPYIASSLQEFWQRWNITVLGWFRNYTYPLLWKIARRVSITSDMLIFNIFLTWFLFALWHGLSETTIFWGFLQFALLLLEHFKTSFGMKIKGLASRLFTLTAIMVSFVFLRTETMTEAGMFLRNLFGLNNNAVAGDIVFVFAREYWVWFSAGIIASIPLIPWLINKLKNRMLPGIGGIGAIVYPLFMVGRLLLVIVYILNEPMIPFEHF